jgi:hypothetical protein
MILNLLAVFSMKLNSAAFLSVAYTIVSLQSDPGLPGGDPDLPDTPLDGGVYLLVAVALIYGYQKLRANRPGAKP